MIGLSGIASLTNTTAMYDQEITTDGTTTVYTVSVAPFNDGSILSLAVSFVTSSTAFASAVVHVHKQNNIGLTVTPVSSRSYNAMTLTFAASGYTAVTITLSSAAVGVLKISPILLNV